MGAHQILGHVGKPQSLQCGAQAQGDVVEHQLAFHPYFQLLALLFELPRENATVGRQADGDAIVLGEVVR